VQKTLKECSLIEATTKPYRSRVVDSSHLNHSDSLQIKETGDRYSWFSVFLTSPLSCGVGRSITVARTWRGGVTEGMLMIGELRALGGCVPNECVRTSNQ